MLDILKRRRCHEVGSLSRVYNCTPRAVLENADMQATHDDA